MISVSIYLSLACSLARSRISTIFFSISHYLSFSFGPLSLLYIPSPVFFIPTSIHFRSFLSFAPRLSLATLCIAQCSLSVSLIFFQNHVWVFLFSRLALNMLFQSSLIFLTSLKPLKAKAHLYVCVWERGGGGGIAAWFGQNKMCLEPQKCTKISLDLVADFLLSLGAANIYNYYVREK